MRFFLSLSLLHQGIIIYLILVNALTFFAYGWDKLASQFGKRRLRERLLYLLTALGGSVGALSAIHFFRHKTRKASFQAVILLIIAIHTGIVFLLFS